MAAAGRVVVASGEGVRVEAAEAEGGLVAVARARAAAAAAAAAAREEARMAEVVSGGVAKEMVAKEHPA